MATLDELQELQNKAKRHRCNADRFKRSAQMIAEHRNNTGPNSFGLAMKGSPYGGQETAIDALGAVLDEYRTDLCRIAELRLKSREREERVAAQLIDAQLAAILDQIDLPKGK